MAESTGKVTFQVYFDLLWNAADQHDLDKSTKQTQRKAFTCHQNDPCDDFEHDPEEEDFTIDQNQDELTEFRQPLQVQSHLEVPRILVQLGHIQRT